MSEVYLLLGSDSYYPSHDNTLAVFERQEAAEHILDEIQQAKHWDAEDSDWATVVERYPWLSDLKFDYYSVEEYEVIGQ